MFEFILIISFVIFGVPAMGPEGTEGTSKMIAAAANAVVPAKYESQYVSPSQDVAESSWSSTADVSEFSAFEIKIAKTAQQGSCYDAIDCIRM